MACHCVHCGATAARIAERCPRCAGYRTVVRDAGARAEKRAGPVRASDVADERVRRVSTGSDAWDRVLGGGAVVPSSVLVWGAPGAGKTTRLSALAAHIANELKRDALYLSAEMPESRVVAAARRGGAPALERLWVWECTDLDRAAQEVTSRKPAVVIWDSAQAFWSSGEYGTDRAIREVVRRALEVGRASDALTWIVSQVTKDGEPAGPHRVLHDVDAVVEVTPTLLRITGKNRYGAVCTAAL